MARTLYRTTDVTLAACLLGIGCAAAEAAKPAPQPLKRIYLMVHALNWLELTPDNPLRQTPQWELWPGRCETCHQYEFGLKDKYYALLSQREPDTGVVVLPSGMKGDPPLIELARKTYGDAVAVNTISDPKELGPEFVRGLEEDRRRAEQARGTLTPGEIGAWERSKTWAEDLRRKLAAQGYTFDPATVEIIAFGEDWCGCAGTYPIHLGRAWGLAQPIVRRFDLMNPDCSPLLLDSTAVEQNLPMPGNIRLFIFRTSAGRLLAEFFEGMHGLWDKPRQVTVAFAPGVARVVDLRGKPVGEAVYGRVAMNVGCGGHTPFSPTLVMAEEGVTLDSFRQALRQAEVADR
jgi:hypothetical protein